MVASVQPTLGDVTVTPASPWGYTRSPDLQARFEAAVGVLAKDDTWSTPDGRSELRADLALEGGGVKGIGLVGAVCVLAEAGYTFRGVAGTSAGAIAAALVAALGKAQEPMSRLKAYMDELPFTQLLPRGLSRLGRPGLGGRAADVLAGLELTWKIGLTTSDTLASWLEKILSELGVHRFGDLRLSEIEDPRMSLEPDHQFSLVVHTADITRRELVRLPWDYERYGYRPDDQSVVDAVRASMSIPFFFRPVQFSSAATTVSVPSPDGTRVPITYEAGTETWVDGGMLRNFPINAFDRIDGEPPRWPTIGVKLSSLQPHYSATKAAHRSFGVGRGCLRTMLNEWDSYAVDEATAGRTIFVDNLGVRTIDFGLSPQTKDALFASGVRAATEFIIEMGENRRVPRTAAEAQALVNTRRREGAGPD